MGLFGGSDPLGGVSSGVEQVWVELRARTDKLKNDVNGALTSVESAMQTAGELSETGLGNSLLNIGTIANVSIAGLAVNAVMSLVTALEQVIVKAGEFVANFLAGGVQINASLQMMNIAFTTILGSTEAASAFMQKLREEAAIFGGGQEILQVGKSLLPYAEGDIAKFEKLLTISKQLAVLDPVQGFKGAGFALREFMSGTTTSLAGRFELPRTELNLMKKEFQDTGDMDAYMESLSQLIGRFGATAESVEAMSNTATASFNKIQFKISELQRFAGAPIFASLQKHLGDFSKLFDENFTSMGQVALRFGSIVAVLIDYIVETGRTLFFIINKVGEFLNNLRVTISDGLGQIGADIIGFYTNILNTLIDIANAALKVLKLPEIKKIDIDKDAIKKQISDFFKMVQGDFSGAKGLFKEWDFSKRVKEYEDMFKDLLEVSGEEWENLTDANEKGQEEDTKQFLEYIQKIRDVLEKGNADLEKEQARHDEKMKDLRDKEREDEQRLLESYNEDKEKANKNAKEKEEEINRDVAKAIEDIEEEHAERIRQIRESTEEQLFDAVNARDAKRVAQILNSAKKETRDANRERDKRINDTKEEGRLKKEQLEREHAEKLAELREQYEKELDQLRDALDRQLLEEKKSHNEKMEEINEGIRERLKLEARGWFESGKLTKEGLETIMKLAISVFGPNGNYIALLDGFNDALTAQVLEALKTLGQLPGEIGTGGNGGDGGPGGETPDDSYDPLHDPILRAEWRMAKAEGYQGSFEQWLKDNGIIPAQFGFEGIVTKPTGFLAGEGGKPERVSITPLNSSSDKGGLPDKFIVDVNVRAVGVSAEFEAQVASQLAENLTQTISNRRTRRG